VSALLAGAPRGRARGHCVAVIRFTNANHEPEVDIVSDSMSEAIAAALRDVDGLVVAPDASLNATEPDRHVTHLARRADCDAVLLGDVRESYNGTDLLVSASLYNGRSGRRIWSDVITASRHCPLADLSAPARTIASSVAAALGIVGTGHRLIHSAPESAVIPPAGSRMDPGGRSAAR
jgi:TolB-like protein